MNIEILSQTITKLDAGLKTEASKAINRFLTLRNWLIGYHIVEYEQQGEDRAQYGDKLLETLAANIAVNGLSFRNLKLFRQFYLSYPQIG